MAETVKLIPCPSGEWTLIADDKSSVCFEWRSPSAIGKWCFGASIPDPDTVHYKTLRPKAPVNLNQLSVGTKIWAMPFGSEDLDMEVITP